MRVTAELRSTLFFALKALSGSRVRERYAWFSRLERAPFSVLQEHQHQLLEQLCRDAWSDVPAYRQRFADAGVADAAGRVDLDRLSQLPLLSRYDLVNHGHSFTRRREGQRFAYVKTGGSTGRPAQIAQDASYRDWCLASTFLFNSWVGLSLGVPYLFLWGAPEDLATQQKRLAVRMNLSLLHGRRLLDATQLSAAKLTAFIAAINERSDCDYLIGYANEVFNLACHSLENNLPVRRRLRAVFTTAENLTPQMRAVIEQVFGCRVLNRYGSRDVGDIACECPYQQGLHVNPLFCRVEVTDEQGRPLPGGQEGQLVVTTLHNHVMPLIRYAIGDMGVLRPAERCACGREWETIVKLTGRTSEALFLPNGERSRAALLHAAFEDLPRLKRYQIHQLDAQQLTIKLRSAASDYVSCYARELDEAAAKLRLWTGVPFGIRFEQADSFDKTPTGKELMVVHKWSPPSAG